MNRLTLSVLGVLFALLFAGVVTAISGVSVRNQFVAQEQGLKAQYKQNQNNYDNYFKKLKESAQVPDQYVADLKSVYAGVMTGRYGADGSKAVFQMLKEQNPKLDAGLYKQLQQIIESGRNSFAADQTTLLDKKRVYETSLNQFPGNLLAGALGFPTFDLSTIDIVTSDETEKAFTAKKSAPIKLKD